jgi:hypothetical protein
MAARSFFGGQPGRLPHFRQLPAGLAASCQGDAEADRVVRAKPLSSTWIPFLLHVLEKIERLLEMIFEVLAHQIQNFTQDRVSQGIIDLIAFFSTDNDLFGAQHGQMLRYVSLLQTESHMDRAYRNLSNITQEFDNGNPRRMRKGLKNTGLEPTEAVLHSYVPCVCWHSRGFDVCSEDRICEISNIVKIWILSSSAKESIESARTAIDRLPGAGGPRKGRFGLSGRDNDPLRPFTFRSVRHIELHREIIL